MPSLKEYRLRIRSVRSTQKITKAMKMVAAAKLRRAQEQAQAARPYAERMERMLASLAANVRGMAGAVFNAAKEVALDHFIAGHLSFTDMAVVVEATLAQVSSETCLGNAAESLEDILTMDELARVRADEAAKKRTKGR